MGINHETIKYDGFGKIVGYSDAAQPELFGELMQVEGQKEAAIAKGHLIDLGHEVMIDVAVSRQFRVIDPETGRILHAHPDGLTEWLVTREEPTLGIWVKEKN